MTTGREPADQPLPIITEESWAKVRAALDATADRFAALVASLPDGWAKATRDWSVTDVAAHVATIAGLYVSLTALDAGRGPDARLPARAANATLDTVGAMNEAWLRELTERDPERLAASLRANVGAVLSATAGTAPHTPVPWLGGSRVPVAGLLAHLLNELLIHGRDIARATRLPWPIPPEDAAWFFEFFFIGLTTYGAGHVLDAGATGRPVRTGRLVAEFRSRYTTPVTIVVHDGRVLAERPGRKPDVRVSYDPAVLALMLFRRVGRPRAVLTGKVVISGPRPWRLRHFFRTIRIP
ncbi:maleylpyruvate isomerase family mycothiol-dependent enzyme [Actinoallomurus rhizosphaericola]|uniref:maleylpyruvate isomerase family mycothiol-dependent enzyme n=1 Tax=Actinoallomurus rhizosphaericola TaxID=2952536 RepID=UPI0020928BF7|nr:maleylpyruvate isomerase family mycothiol-dependent enzyme [Actinoallomurus rhizosphaericola]MCO5998071.1 maleylpyruvate isomerase family mycothiol-dependent enzyme [Actinoallomurus rhizosphaericola]